ncbi:hybrid sensor histidine kinase/response regulator [Roseicella aquatilis]|uniref:Chemotaxis protein CheA n=1 Tax=Roseicella aquatilis TaxID=2527868 RepID=A0A4V2WKB5_9PROT|nr:chemotaxis protein CheW [Roseicella aquatilis]TCZ57988.1 hybrid sensor histidine kinase/response regulator [Roseicella aquatilis]
MDDLIAEFLAETTEALAELDTALVRFEREGGGGGDTLAGIFRMVHSVKGTCGFLGLARLEGIAHAAETLLGRYRDRELEVTSTGVTAVLVAIDAIRSIIQGLAETGSEPTGDDTALLAMLAEAARDATAPPPPPAAVATADAEPEPAPAPPAAAPAHPVTTGAAAGPDPVQAIRVSLGVLDDLMTLASELVLVRNQLLQVARGQENSPFTTPLQRLSRITTELQEGVMKTRMQPVSAAWNKLPRLVRDLAAELGKKIELELTGGETELDRQVMESIRDPLTHMVRNSADHGLEDPEVRRRAGKPEAGRISLAARQEGGRIVIALSDDGRGIDFARVRARALERGLATEAEIAAMRDQEVARFIFRPGFSTASGVTAVSGRGVGMDVVRTNIERIGGTVELESEPGRGTTLSLSIPLTLAIVSALVVQAGGERFAVPQAAVAELVRVGGTGAPVEWLDATPVLRLRGQLLPLVPLGPLLGLAPPPAAGPIDGFVAVLQTGGLRYGLLVDGIFDTEEVVVKPVAPILRDLSVFSGNTILGDGSVIMILDPAGIGRSTGAQSGTEPAAATLASAQRRDDAAQLLLFRIAGSATPVAVPLSLITRLELLQPERIENASGQLAVQYRERLMPLVPIGAWTPPEAGRAQPTLVFQDGVRAVGLLVEEILDVVEQQLSLRSSEGQPGFLGSAIIGDRATDVLDCAYWLKQGDPAWFERAGGPPPRVLVVEDSSFFRQLVVPSLVAAGYSVTACVDAAEALRHREEGLAVDVIVTDIEMPGMDGFGLLAALRRGGAWADIPVLALTGRQQPADAARGLAAGFTDYIQKFDRDRVLDALTRAIGERAA